MDALLESPIKFVTTHHEQGAAFMADVYGRLTGRAGVCMSTLGPGATNLITGVADANMDRAPVVAIAGQGATTRLHKESHQILDLVNLFQPITKYATQIREPQIVPEIVRKAFKVAQTEKPGATFIDFPENIAEMQVDGKPIEVQTAYTSTTPDAKIDQAAKIISEAKFPIILAGNGVIRQGASDSLTSFAEMLRIPVANTFMAKGVMPFSNPLSLGTIGLKARDLPWFAFEKADVVICVGYDMVEYHPDMWNPNNDKVIVHIDALPAEVDAHYIVAVGALGDIGSTLRGIALKAKPQRVTPFGALRKALVEDRAEYANDTASRSSRRRSSTTCAKCSAPRTSRSPTSARTRCGCRACTAPSVPTPASSPTASRRWASRCPARSPPSSPTPTARSSPSRAMRAS